MTDVQCGTLYELFGVDADCSFEELRAAYRSLARTHHPDVAVLDHGATTMAEINAAWRVLSDTERRQDYDASVVIDTSTRQTVPVPQPAPQTARSRRRAWAIGVQGQIARLSRLAGRSATQTLLIRQPRAPRATYDEIVSDIVIGLCEETESRVRAARAAGAAPLDLGVGATLVGIRTLGDRLRREASLGVTERSLMAAELLDRMWDVLAHELPSSLAMSLGGNPHIARSLTSPTRG